MDMDAKELIRTLLAVGKELTDAEFASLLAVGSAGTRGSAPVIPREHSARLIALGYIADLGRNVRLTTAGRIRIAAGQ